MSSGTAQTTPLASCHEQCGARMIDFSGWWMPVQYEGIVAEHHATRSGATLFDTCHMGRFRVSGPTSLDTLSRLVTPNLRTMQDGQCRYGFLLNDNAGILDDLIVYRFTESDWMLVVNAGTQAGDLAWLQAHWPAGDTLSDHSSSLAKIDVQGPTSGAVVSAVIGNVAADLKYFRFRTFEYAGSPAVISRTGYTGEIGYELYVDAGAVAKLWADCLDAGAQPAGLGARDTLRLEAALPLVGHELSDAVTPLEANGMRYASKGEEFIGRRALLARQEQGPERCLVGFRLEGRQSARAGNRVRTDDGEIGQVTSGSFAPTLGYAIGMAYLDADRAEAAPHFSIDTGRRELDAEPVALPFYKRVS